MIAHPAGGQDHVRRRTFLLRLGGLAVASSLARYAKSDSAPTDSESIKGQPLRPWRPGYLDIHHIATGRGDSSLILAPDGTTIMMDAGAMYAGSPFNFGLKPSGARRPGEWIARYARRRLGEIGADGLDYLIVTHLHPDHVGDIDPALPKASDGDYLLTGVSDVAALLPIGLVLDRGAPGYEDVDIRSAPFAQNYMKFIRARELSGRRVERLRAGNREQIHLVRGSATPFFGMRTLAVNGEVWTGQGEMSRRLFPPRERLRPEDVPDENACSAAFRLEYGAFSYFAAGDLTSNTLEGDLPWRDVETEAALVCGSVDVAVAAHHGLYDSTSADVVRALRARVWLIDAWHVSHPSLQTLERLFSQRLYSGPREVFATGLAEANSLVSNRLTKRLSSAAGHVVVRVPPGGKSYQVIITDNSDELDRVVEVFGPYLSAGGARLA
jgi:beta-lactamase superfamily II metal-dependent hydrolase